MGSALIRIFRPFHIADRLITVFCALSFLGKGLENRAVRFSARGARVGFSIVSRHKRRQAPDVGTCLFGGVSL